MHGMLGVHAQHHAVEDQRSAPETFLADSRAMVTQQTHKFVQVSCLSMFHGFPGQNFSVERSRE